MKKAVKVSTSPSKFPIPPLDTRPCYKPWIVTVKVIKANDLNAADSVLHAMKKGGGISALSDPMVFIQVDGCVARTSVINQTLNPKWTTDKSFVFRVLVLQGSPVEFDVYDWDEDGQHDFLGKASIDLRTVTTIGVEKRFILNLSDEKGEEDQGTLTVEVMLEANFSLGDKQRDLYFVKQVNNVQEDVDRESFVKFVSQLTVLGVKHAQWLTEPSHGSMCLKLNAHLDELLEKTARQTDLQSALSQTSALENMSLEATLEGVNEIARHFERCMTMLMHSFKHNPNLAATITLVLNVHFSRALSELNRWCHKRLDNTAVLIGSPKTYEHLSRGKGSSPLGSILPDIVRFLAESNELTHIQALDSTHQRTLASSSKGIFENILYNTIGDFSDVEKCDFEISVKHKAFVLHGINTISMAHMLEIEHLISNEVNLRGGTRSNLNSLFLNISKPYFSAIKRVDEKQLKLSAGGVIALVCGSKGWGGLSSDWATDCLQLMEVQIKSAKASFAPSQQPRCYTLSLVLSPDSASGLSRQVSDDCDYVVRDEFEGYRILMLATYQIVAHTMDSLIYRFLHMFKRLRHFEDVESNKNSNAANDLSTIEVPQEEVEIILNCLCKFMKDANRVREGMLRLFEDDKLTEKLDALSDRLTTSLDALEMAAVSQLSYLVLKCFSATFASNRDLSTNLDQSVEAAGDLSQFSNFARKNRFIPGHSGFNILNIHKPVVKLNQSENEHIKCTWPQICNEISDILQETIPILEQKLTENDDEHFMIKAKSYLCEALALRIYYFFIRNVTKGSGSKLFPSFGMNMLNSKPKVKVDSHQVLVQCSEFHTSMKYLTARLVGEKDADENNSCLGDGPWRTRFDWLLALSELMAQSDIAGIATKHSEICNTFSLPVQGQMLDLSIHLCIEIRQEPPKNVAPHFAHLVATMNNSQGSGVTTKKQSKGDDRIETSRSHNLFVVAKGVKGMIEKILRKYDAKNTASKVLTISGVTSGTNTTSNPMATVTKYAKRLSATPLTMGSAITNPSTSGPNEEEEDFDVEIEVEIISAMKLINLDEKHGTMSSPFVRCSLLHDYHRDNNEKYVASKKTNTPFSVGSESSNSATSASAAPTTTSRQRLWTASSTAAFNSMSTSSNGNTQDNGVSTSSASSLSASNQHGSHNQELFVDHFDIVSIPNNLNPVWRVGMNEDGDHNDNIGIFHLPRKPNMFWGMALEVDVLTTGERLMGTAIIDLMEWDEDSAQRSVLTSWYPLFLKEKGIVGSISLQIFMHQSSDATYLRASVR